MKSLLDFADKLGDSYEDYLTVTRNILLTTDNMEDLLYSIVSYEAVLDSAALEKAYGKARYGVFLRVKYDSYYEDHLVFVRQLHVKNNQKERTQWLELSKFRIKSDLYRGFVSLDQIQGFENANYSQQKLKVRGLQMVSYNESLNQKKSIRNISHLKSEHEE